MDGGDGEKTVYLVCGSVFIEGGVYMWSMAVEAASRDEAAAAALALVAGDAGDAYAGKPVSVFCIGADGGAVSCHAMKAKAARRLEAGFDPFGAGVNMN
jgi:hypothetical protein